MKEFAKALATFQQECENIELNADVKVATKAGGSYTFSYATLGQIKDVVRPLLGKNGLSIMQGIGRCDDDIEISFWTRVQHVSGEFLVSKLPFKGVWNNAQEFGSLVTYMRRYGLVTALGLVAEDDDDGNTAVGNDVEKTERPAKVDKYADEPKPIKFTENALKEIGSRGVTPIKEGVKNGRKWYLYQFQNDKGFVDQKQHEYILSFFPKADIDDLPF